MLAAVFGGKECRVQVSKVLLPLDFSRGYFYHRKRSLYIAWSLAGVDFVATTYYMLIRYQFYIWG